MISSMRRLRSRLSHHGADSGNAANGLRSLHNTDKKHSIEMKDDQKSGNFITQENVSNEGLVRKSATEAPQRRLRSRDSTGLVSRPPTRESNNSETPRKKKKKIVEYVVVRSDSESEEDIKTSAKRSEPEESRKLKRIKLTLKPPSPTITHPDHVVKPQHQSLRQFLESFKTFHDEELPLEEYEERVQQEIELVTKIREAIHNKILRIDPQTNKIVKHPKPKPFIDPFLTLPTHHDHFIAQAVKMSKIFQDGKRARIGRCRKVANMVENHFKKMEGEKDRELREHEKQMKKLARNTVMMVKKRWREVEKAYKIIVDKRKELEKIEESKKTMNRMVMDSSLRAVGHAIGGSGRMSEETEDSESDLDLSADEQSDESGDELKLDEDDSNLTQEELRKKYAFLNNYKEDEQEEEETVENGNASFVEKPDAIVDITEEDIERFKSVSQEDHNSILDSDESLSDSDDEESEYESDSDDEQDSAGGGLASLFGATITNDDSADEEVDIEEDGDTSETTVEKEETDQKSVKMEVSSDKFIDNERKQADDEEKDTEIKNKQVEDVKELSSNDAKTSNDSTPIEEDKFASIPDVPVPPLLKGTLRTYQKLGLNWLANLYNNNTNGILADEMGLGKTIQTISLLSYLACEKHIWGPHLIVVPTSVMLNWEMEFKRFAPGFKVLTYYGNPQQRKEKRKGWNKPDAFHVCITSYQLVCHDHQSFRRKRWEYMILDEAHNIKNFRTTRWQSLLNFNTNRRLLLTGTPLQNNLAELWSLLYFLMPSAKNVSNMPEGFASLDDFQQWFGRPVDKVIEGGHFENDKETKETISKLHKVLRPYLLRRLKADVETQMPLKYEHIVYCRLSKRQRFLYDDFMSRAQTKETLASGNFLSIINCLMQLRKVCNHPDLFEVRPILTSFAVNSSIPGKYSKGIPKYLSNLLQMEIDLETLGFIFTNQEKELSLPDAQSIMKLNARERLLKDCGKLEELLAKPVDPNYDDINEFYRYFKYLEQKDALGHSKHIIYINDLRCSKMPVYGRNLLDLLHVDNFFNTDRFYHKLELHCVEDLIKPLSTRVLSTKDAVDTYAFVTPKVVALDMKNQVVSETTKQQLLETNQELFKYNSVHEAQVKLSIQFPDKSLLLYDSGKLQKLAKLLYELKNNGHRALIFTQMTKVLDVLEKFLNSLGYLYLRLDGATKIEDRQLLTEKFNRDPRITCFILSTRSGGLGINLTGADTVIFYDNDWNPAMDKQCQDRCHRIGQTRDVHIYRFVSEYTIEENIMKKSNYKRKLDNVVIQEGDFTTDYFGKLTLSDLLGEEGVGNGNKLLMANGNIDSLAQAEDAEDAMAAKEAIKESQLDVEDFDEATTAASKSVSNSPAPLTNGNGTVERSRSISRTPTAGGIDSEAAEKFVKSEELNEDDDEEYDDDEEDEVGHIDEYMLRFIENGHYY